MKKAITFLVLLIPFISNGQKFKRNEIGLGIGHIQYNLPIYKETTFYNSFTITVPFISKKYYYLNMIDSNVKTNFKTSPVFYYTYHFSNKFSFRINFQYFNLTSNEVLDMHYDDNYYINYQIDRKTLNTNLGIEHSLYSKKHKQLYWGIELNIEKGTQHEIGNGKTSWGGLPFSTNQKSDYMMGGINGLIGTKINIFKNVNA